MIKSTFCAAIALVATLSVQADDNVCPCVPLGHEWIVTACETWNCAQSMMILANGDPYVVAVPTGSETWKWIILRRVVSGSFAVSPDAPFAVEQFDRMSDAGARFSALEHEALPMFLTTLDGKMLVVSLRPSARRRAALPQ
jgi:hypothetical protein